MQSAPAVDFKSHPKDMADVDGITIQPITDPDTTTTTSEGIKGREDTLEDMDIDSPRKMSFEVRSKTSTGGTGGSNGTPVHSKRTMDTNILGGEEYGELDAPKKKLASIQQIEKEQRDERVLEREVSRMAAKYSGEDRKNIPPEEKKKMIQTLVKGIPTTKEELFEYELKWEAIDQVRRERKRGAVQ